MNVEGASDKFMMGFWSSFFLVNYLLELAVSVVR